MHTIHTDVFIQTSVRHPIQTIIFFNGWNFFRNVEYFLSLQIHDLTNQPSILDCGGGILTMRKTHTLLKKNDNIWITSTNKQTYFRARHSCKNFFRPKLSSVLREDEELLTSLFVRTKHFKNLANFILDGKNSTICNVKNVLLLHKKYNLKGQLEFARRFSRNSF